jgi:Zn-dependent protease
MPWNRRGGLSLGRWLGIPVRMHWTWLLVLTLVAASLSFGYFPLFRRAVSPSSYLLLGVVTAGLFCLSLLAHELSHALVARRERIPVRGITLFAFGGVAELTESPRTPGAEFRMAVVGPMTSLGLAWLFGALSGAAGSPYVALPLQWLAGTNLALGLFNLLPGFPLDGGRVFRAALWQWMGDQRRATRVAAVVGQAVGWVFVGLGVVAVFRGGLFNGLWMMMIGSFIRTAAAGELAYVEREAGGDRLDPAAGPPAPPAPPAPPVTPQPPFVPAPAGAARPALWASTGSHPGSGS